MNVGHGWGRRWTVLGLCVVISSVAMAQQGNGKTAQEGQDKKSKALPRGEAVPRRPAAKEGPPSILRTDQIAVEIAFWNSIVGSSNIKDFDAYLEQYPEGHFVRLARNRREILLADGRVNKPAEAGQQEKRAGAYRSVSFTTGSMIGGEWHARQETQMVYVEDLGGGVGVELVQVHGGSFQMGSPKNEPERGNDEGPQHEVRVRDFLMGRFEVTQQQWRVVAGYPKEKIEIDAAPSYFKGDTRPVETVSWDDVAEFLARLNRKLGLTEKTGYYRLPSEAEWEYAVRAGTTTPFAFGGTITSSFVNYNGNYPYAETAKGVYRMTTVPVGTLGVANPLGLYDMLGNVWEWCADDYHDNYEGAPTDGRVWLDSPSGTMKKVIRGGGAGLDAGYCRSANRAKSQRTEAGGGIGFRLVKTMP